MLAECYEHNDGVAGVVKSKLQLVILRWFVLQLVSVQCI